MLKRIAALALAVLVIVAMVGCGSKRRETITLTLSTEDAEAILKAAGIMLPDAATAAGANTVIKYYSYQNMLQNYSDTEMVQTGYWTFKEKYHSDIEYIETTYADRFTQLANLILSGDVPDFYDAWATDFPARALNNMFAPVDDYIDYNDPLWEGMKYYADSFFSLGDKHYMFVTDVSFNSMVVYNRRVFDEWGFDDPAELFYNGEWTWDEMLDMALDFTDSDAGHYAFNSWGTDAALISSVGVSLVEFDPEQGKFVSNIDDPRLERAANALSEFQKNGCEFPMWSNGWVLNYEIDGGGLKEGATLFGMAGSFIMEERRDKAELNEKFGDMDAGEVMIVPVPRDPNGDGEYYIDSKPKGYCLIMNAPHPEAVALLAACDRFKIVDPTVINFDKKQLMEKKGWNKEMLDMWDEMYSIAHSHRAVVEYGEGLGTDLATRVDTMINFNRMGGEDSWAQRKEANKDTIEYYVEDLNTQIAALS